MTQQKAQFVDIRRKVGFRLVKRKGEKQPTGVIALPWVQHKTRKFLQPCRFAPIESAWEGHGSRQRALSAKIGGISDQTLVVSDFNM